MVQWGWDGIDIHDNRSCISPDPSRGGDWECQTLQCSTCTLYPVPMDEAREDAGAKQILFHVYEYKVSLRKDGTECR